MFYSKGLKVLEDIADFLDKHREIVYKNLDHGAMPWLSLIFTVKLNFPSANLSRLNHILMHSRVLSTEKVML